MKTNNKILKSVILICALVIFGITSCDDFLEVEVRDQLVVDGYYESDNELVLSVTGAYAALNEFDLYSANYYLQKLFLEDYITTGEIKVGTGTHYNYNFTSVEPTLLRMWWVCYKGIFRCNTTLATVPAEVKNEKLIARVKDEARFLRAFYYWHLLNMWREVPLRTVENMDVYAVAKSTRDEVYTLMVEDLTTVIESKNLPLSYDGKVNNEKGRATMGAAMALLGKVYLYMEQFEDAADVFKQVVDLGVYSLTTDPEYTWNLKNENNAMSMDVIFEVQFDSKVGGVNAFFSDGTQANEGNMRFRWVDYSGWKNFVVTSKLLDLYAEEPGDRRRAAYIRLDGEPIEWANNAPAVYGGAAIIRKGLNQKPVGGDIGTDENTPVIRYADVLLMYAESLIRQSAPDLTLAAFYINEVRKNAFLPADYVPIETVSANTGQSMFELLKKERSKELAFESHRFNDLRRWGQLETELAGRYKPGSEYYPIPQDDINKSGGLLVQDPNY